MKKGFTLIEVFIVVAIFSMIIVTVYGIFYGGIKICKRVQNISFSEEKVILFLEKFSRHLRQIYEFEDEDLAFKGEPDKIVFVTFDKILGGFVQYEYSFSAGEGKVILTYQSVGDVLAGNEEKSVKKSVSLDGLKLSYLGFSKESGSLIETDIWEEDSLPYQVKIEVEKISQKKASDTSHVYVADGNRKQALGYKSREYLEKSIETFTKRVFLPY